MKHSPEKLDSTESKFKHIMELGELPLHKRNTAEKNDVATETFQFFKEFLKSKHFDEYNNSTEAYNKLPHKKIIARREDPRKIFELCNSEIGYEIDFADDRYANCVEWNPHTDGRKNLYNAFMEGFTNLNGVVVVVGFSPDRTNDLIQMSDSIQNFHGLDRSGVRSYRGTVDKDHLHFITIRIPAHLIPESELTEEEIDKLDEYNEKIYGGVKTEPVMVFRTYLPNKTIH